MPDYFMYKPNLSTTVEVLLTGSNVSSSPVWRMWAAAWMVTAVFSLANLPTPLYVYWQQQLSFSSGMLTVIFAAYFAGLLVTLLVAGQLSDQYGHRAVLLPGLLAAIVACVLFATASSVVALGIARFLTGVAVGVIVSAGIATVVDMGDVDHRRQASQVASVAMVFGAGLGPLLAGTLAGLFIYPIMPIFAIELIVLAGALVVVGILPLGKIPHNVDGSRHRPVKLRLPTVPAPNRRHLAWGIAVFAPGITATAFVLSLGPSLLTKMLDVHSPLIAGSMACAMFLAAASVQLIASQLHVRSIFLLGAVLTIVAMVSLSVAILTLVPALLIIAALLAGAGHGLGQLGGLTLIGSHVPDNRRAEANAVLNIGGYIPAGMLPVATGYLIDAAGLGIGATAFATVLACATALAGIFILRTLHRD